MGDLCSVTYGLWRRGAQIAGTRPVRSTGRCARVRADHPEGSRPKPPQGETPTAGTPGRGARSSRRAEGAVAGAEVAAPATAATQVAAVSSTPVASRRLQQQQQQQRFEDGGVAGDSGGGAAGALPPCGHLCRRACGLRLQAWGARRWLLRGRLPRGWGGNLGARAGAISIRASSIGRSRRLAARLVCC
jgi:hypothetical protein